MKKNEDIRAAARQKKVYLYEIADALGVSEPTFIRWLRKELSDPKKIAISTAIDLIAEQRDQNGGAALNIIEERNRANPHSNAVFGKNAL